ncbi:hypothetical protein [Bradyrhizobium sp. 62]|uniref:hypothetical protein n=1 Tax=Bradyrhizobium sp. 62 TaxID=1043588 RepID=UPI001FF8DD35|nr:hypothetical protein [Bradyrhizobium sp. 62]MCK1366375.1 hypothetical protein [Bradyrhizobium sp. 62]
MWGLIFAGISAAASAFSAVDSALSNRSIIDSLSRVIHYLEQIDAKLDVVLQQNKEILRKLDELPRVVRAIVQEIVDVALLDERYATIQSIKLNITKLKLGKSYRITEPGWRELSGTVTYLFLHENRISYLFRLILACELALAATRNEAKPFIIALLQGKLDLLRALETDFKQRLASELDTLKSMLDQTQYIVSHNLSNSLDDFSKLIYVKQPDRMRTIQYSERVCHTKIGHCGEEHEVCHDEPRQRQEPDTPFHSARDNFVSQIEQRRAIIIAMLNDLKNVRSVIAEFEKYLKRVNELHAHSPNVMLFHSITSVTALVHPSALKPTLTTDETEAMKAYYSDVPKFDASAPVTLDLSDRVEIDGRFAVISAICPI